MLDPRKIKRIAINTGGGDAPGLNAVIRAATLAAIERGWEVYGIRHGYRGLIDTNELVPLTRESVRGITHLGGTILGTASKDNPFEYPIQTPEGVRRIDISDKVVENFRARQLDALICIGGDGSMRLAQKFIQKGIPIVGVPKTIDNDLSGTVATFGFDTAVSTATDAIDKLHSTAESHERVMVVEVMGRYAGWIALSSGVAGTADIILMPEIPFDFERVCEKVMERERAGRHFSIAVVAEGAKPKGGQMMVRGPKEAGREVLLGGVGQYVAEEITRRTGKETRYLVLGHLQRGGGPTTFDRLIGLRFGAAAVRTLAEGQVNVMIALDPPTVKTIPLTSAIERMKSVPLDSDTVLTARALGICLGD
ncbi:6-phosphofructokinase [Myxococcus sp. RHSTA-1-4]|uniref:6-phosphofructokinase n=1 Tax=Myxococcus sp. RHSTA-1-4 TaxID=2874601 RepID=UPI001CBD5591|nr:ATP-dependent 6-phosphofructokinase [Myxococcus sp. RHSTA-1-4]MBZ4420189.1 ATP-dependent 6-phosphofructokinase [Myxococcus sp. RHSTA-1-4]